MKWILSFQRILDLIDKWVIKNLSDITINDNVTPSYILWLWSLVNQWIIRKIWSIDCALPQKSYLQRCNFWKTIWLSEGSVFTGWSDNLFEIQIIDGDVNLHNIDVIVQKILKKMLGLTNPDTDLDIQNKIQNTVLTMITEVVSNVSTHSQADFTQNACMYMMQYYETTKILRLAVVDCWVWIVHTLKNSRHYKDWEKDDYYMDLAIQQYHTRDESIWRGNGLYMCSTIIEATHSQMDIISHNHHFQQIWQRKEIVYNKYTFPWTLVSAEFKLDNIKSVDMEAMFMVRWGTPTMIEEIDDYYSALWW